MNQSRGQRSPKTRARILGLVYLLYFVTAIAGALLMKGVVVAGDAAATARNLLSHESSFRAGFTVELISNALYIALTALFYDFFRPVSRRLSLVAAFLSLVGCAVQIFGSIFQLAPFLILGGGADYLRAFRPDELQAFSLFFLKLNFQAFSVGIVFFAFFDILIGCLIIKSTFLPRILGWFMIIAGVGWLTYLSPPLATSLGRYVQPIGFLAELALMLWLLIKGVNRTDGRNCGKQMAHNVHR